VKQFAAGVLFSAALLAGFASIANTASPGVEDKVVYHLNQGLEQASDGLRNINNHLQVNPKAKIVVVTHSRGVDFLMKGAKDKNGNPYDIPVEDLKARGVRFEVCEITLTSRKLDKSQFIEEATYVPSGVAEVTKLQQREGYAYLKP
jgi:hypothetical protein